MFATIYGDGASYNHTCSPGEPEIVYVEFPLMVPPFASNVIEPDASGFPVEKS